MGRGRLRRGFSLEVIFEEDSDFCSHLDSLDSRGIRRDCRDREEFSIDSLWDEFHQHHHLKGRTSGGIKDQTFFPNPQTQFNGFDDISDMEFVEWDEFSPEEERGEREASVPRSASTNSAGIGNGRRSRVSRREILERNWQLGSEEEDGDSDDTVKRKIVDKTDRCWEREEDRIGWNTYISQDETDSSDNYAFADPADDVTSFASTSFDSSPSSPNGCKEEKILSIPIRSTRASLDVNGDDQIEFDGKKKTPSDPPASLLTTDVKKVRALFELQTTPPTIQLPSGVKDGKRRLDNGDNQKNQESENERKTSETRERREADFLTLASGTGFVSSIRSAFSQMSINQLAKHDFLDLLSNDKVVIEEAPDIFQTLRSRGRECPPEYSSSGTLCRSGASTLRRSKSMGNGISKIGFSDSPSSTSSSCEELKRPCIIAEEMPAPDTVKNVRTVFEKMLSRPRQRTSSSEEHYVANGSSPISTNANFSSVKSNPTSKILRSESMRDKEDSHKGRLGKPISSTANGKNSNQVSSTGKDGRKPTLTRKFSEPIATLAKNFQNGGPAPMPSSHHNNSSSVHNGKVVSYNGVGSVSSQSSTSEDELPSLVSSVGSLMECGEDVKIIPQEVLNRIRSCGTTTTYFGGQIVSKTVKNRKLPLPDQTPSSAFDPFPPHSTSPNYIPEERLPLTTSSRKSAEGNEFGHNPNYSHFEEMSPPPSRPSYPYSLPLELFGQLGMGPRGDTTPRIISVLPKSPQSSPSKSPVLMEGRNSPEGCENLQPVWINEISSDSKENGHSICSHKFSSDQDTNNNCNGFVSKVLVGGEKKEMEESDKKFSQVTPGAWF